MITAVHRLTLWLYRANAYDARTSFSLRSIPTAYRHEVLSGVGENPEHYGNSITARLSRIGFADDVLRSVWVLLDFARYRSLAPKIWFSAGIEPSIIAVILHAALLCPHVLCILESSLIGDEYSLSSHFHILLLIVDDMAGLSFLAADHGFALTHLDRSGNRYAITTSTSHCSIDGVKVSIRQMRS